MEALNNTLHRRQHHSRSRRAAPGPGPIVEPDNPTVAITAVGGQPIPQPPQGGLGNVDLVLPAPGQTDVGFSTTGVPTGTTVNVTVKPQRRRLADCHAGDAHKLRTNGACLGNVSFNLAAGAYFVEARATFATP